MKSLRKDLIEVSILEDWGVFYWYIKNINWFRHGKSVRTSGHSKSTPSKAKANFRYIAKLNDWKNYKFV